MAGSWEILGDGGGHIVWTNNASSMQCARSAPMPTSHWVGAWETGFCLCKEYGYPLAPPHVLIV